MYKIKYHLFKARQSFKSFMISKPNRSYSHYSRRTHIRTAPKNHRYERIFRCSSSIRRWEFSKREKDIIVVIPFRNAFSQQAYFASDRFAMISRGDLHTNAFDFAFDSFLIQLRNTAVRFRSMRMPGQAFLRLVAVGNGAVFLAKSPLAKNRCQHPIMNNKRKHPCRVIYALVQQLVPTYQTFLLSSFATLFTFPRD